MSTTLPASALPADAGPTPSSGPPAPQADPAPDPRGAGPGAAEETEGMYGPRGWSVRAGVWHELAQCRDDLRSTVLPADYGLAPTGLIDDGVPVDDYTPFHDLGPATARRLLDILPRAQLEDRQNLGPTLGTLLRACARAGGRVRLSGYAIGPQRRDERLSVEGLWVADPDLLDHELCEIHDEHCHCREVWALVSRRYDLDALAMPDEVKTLRRYWTHGPVGTWLWWD
ncbi:MAG: hypothetical protein Q4C85_04720 [Actinomyces sp.]|uniref:hypothetical protein n=1 Tax=Actinomyces sp. TaxID=29317 RepID=UPI0026DD21B7|nr:hypothetical protein [Actinomyces sp.]MDO4243053.1 hypothetical protein [Actinomyces sp.]